MYIINFISYTCFVVFKIISLNLWHGGRLLPDILNFLKSEDADIVVLQEVYASEDRKLPARFRSLEALKPLGYPYQDFVPAYSNRLDEGLVPEGTAVLSKFPVTARWARTMIESSKDEYTDTPDNYPILPRILQGVRLDTPGGELNVYNLHGVWDLAGDRYSPERQKMAEVIINEIKDKTNVILAGDSNASMGNRMFDDIGKHLKNAFEPVPRSTFNMRRKTDHGYATAAVDIIYASSALNVLSATCPDVDVSDHRPLVATLSLN